MLVSTTFLFSQPLIGSPTTLCGSIRVSAPKGKYGASFSKDKGTRSLLETYERYRSQWDKQRGMDSVLPMSFKGDRNADKLSEMLAEFKEIQSNQIIMANWMRLHDDEQQLRLLFENGIFVTHSFDSSTLNLKRIFIDKSLYSKKTEEYINDSVFSDTGDFAVFTYKNRPEITLTNFLKPGVNLNSKGPVKLQTMNPRSVSSLIGDMCRAKGRLSLNLLRDTVLLWWEGENLDRNIIFSERILIGPKAKTHSLSMRSSYSSDGALLYATFSSVQYNSVIFIEQSLGDANIKSEFGVVLARRSYINGNLQAGATQYIKTSSLAKMCCLDIIEKRLALACQGGELIIFNSSSGDDSGVALTLAKPPLRSQISCLTFHPDGGILVVASRGGDIVFFDVSLTPLRLLPPSDDMMPQFIPKRSLENCILSFGDYLPANVNISPVTTLAWTGMQHVLTTLSNGLYSNDLKENIERCRSALCVSLSEGPTVLVTLELGMTSRGQLRSREIVAHHLHENDIQAALSLLLALNWDHDAPEAIISLDLFTNYLLRQNTIITKGEQAQLERALQHFWSHEFKDSEIYTAYKGRVCSLHRRFFHALLRCGAYERAFATATTLDAADLFVLLHSRALSSGEKLIAHKALQQLHNPNMLDSRKETNSTTFELYRSLMDPPKNTFGLVATSTDDELILQESLKNLEMNLGNEAIDNIIDAWDSSRAFNMRSVV